jgi:hypothetical protein
MPRLLFSLSQTNDGRRLILCLYADVIVEIETERLVGKSLRRRSPRIATGN